VAPRKPPDEVTRAISRALKTTREKRGLTAAELARRAGVTANAILHVEHAKSAPSLAVVFELVDALGCSWSDVLGPLPHAADGDGDYQAGYRAGVGDASAAVRELLDG
jgi:transcriptional regulator with XRE-family HTH domain